tara:strand:- start:581 stop:781 length:201 start_codon:yes stop_codon:yes gene_type:complete
MTDFRFDKLFLQPFVAVNKEDEEDVLFGWHEECEELPNNFSEGYNEEDEEMFINLVKKLEKNLKKT